MGNPLSPEVQENQKTIERIMYLSSLASVQSDVDVMLDTLRSVTSRARDRTFSTDDQAKLAALEEELKDYLVTKDPIRTFDRDSLEKRLSHQTQPVKPGVLLRIIASSFGTSLLPLLAPPYTNIVEKIALFSVPLFFLLLSVGTTWLYLSALADFKSELRTAFRYICAGTLMLGVYFSQHAVVQAFHLYDHPLFQYSGFTWIITIAFILFYFGLRSYAKLLQITSVFTSLPLMLGSMALGLLIAIVLPHSSRVAHEAFFYFSFSGIILLLIISALGAGIARSIIRTVTSAYAKSMRWLYIYLAMTSIASVAAAAALAALGLLYGSTLTLIIVICGIVPINIILYTGYSFKKETSL